MKLKTSELIDRFQSLSNISHDKTTGRIAMAVMCNIKALEELYKATLQTIEDTKVKYADNLKAGRRTEVNTISGAVVRAGEKTGVDVPTHRMIVNMVHAMEDRDRKETK